MSGRIAPRRRAAVRVSGGGFSVQRVYGLVRARRARRPQRGVPLSRYRDDRRFGGFYGPAVPMDERQLDCRPDHPLIGWRIFRVRRFEGGFVLTAPLVHDPQFEVFPSRVIGARCYEHDHRAPAPGCRCGLYAEVEGTLDSLSGYLLDSAHDVDPPIYAEVACTGRVFVDLRGVRAGQLEVLRLATSDSLWPDPSIRAQAVQELELRYGIAVDGIEAVPSWVLANDMPQGAPLPGATLDLDALLAGLGLKAVAPMDATSPLPPRRP